MKKDYVIYKGKKYNSGDTIRINWYTRGYKAGKFPYTGTFLDCDEEKDEYRFIVNGQTYCYNKICFYKTMRDGKEKKPAEKKKATFKDELNIDGLFIAWMWYIFVMGLSIIFNCRVIIWICASLIFFDYRKTKLKEAGYQ